MVRLILECWSRYLFKASYLVILGFYLIDVALYHTLVRSDALIFRSCRQRLRRWLKYQPLPDTVAGNHVLTCLPKHEIIFYQTINLMNQMTQCSNQTITFFFNNVILAVEVIKKIKLFYQINAAHLRRLAQCLCRCSRWRSASAPRPTGLAPW